MYVLMRLLDTRENEVLLISRHVVDKIKPLTFRCTYVCMYVCMYVLAYERMNVCMYVCLYVCTIAIVIALHYSVI